jgi:hypothetical protein
MKADSLIQQQAEKEICVFYSSVLTTGFRSEGSGTRSRLVEHATFTSAQLLRFMRSAMQCPDVPSPVPRSKLLSSSTVDFWSLLAIASHGERTFSTSWSLLKVYSTSILLARRTSLHLSLPFPIPRPEPPTQSNEPRTILPAL